LAFARPAAENRFASIPRLRRKKMRLRSE